MKPQDDMLVFDEDEAVKFILKYLPKQFKSTVDETDVEYVLDVMVDFYEKNGFMEEDSAEEANIDEDDMFNFIRKIISKEQVISLSDDELQAVLDGEFEYGKSIGIYKEEE